MKRLIQIIGIALILNEACQPIDGEVETSLSHKKIGESHLLVMTVKNNSTKPIYIPELSCLMISKFDSIRIIDSKGKVENDQFVENELQHGISFYGPPIDGKVITDSCSDERCIIGEEIELDLPPFTLGKKMIRSIIQYEYQNLIVANSPKMPTGEDITFIKSLIFSKYSGSIFLKAKESFSDCITINTLFLENETYKIYFHYTPPEKIEKYTYEFKFGGDTLTVTSKHLNKYMDYVLYDKPLVSDTIIINP